MNKIILLISIFILSSCKYGPTFSKLESLKDSRDQVEVLSTQELNQENQKKISTYFSTIKDISYQFMNSPKMQKYTHKKFTKYFQESLCDDVLLDESFYTAIMNRCTVNGFYICSDEVKAYKRILSSIKKILHVSELDAITKKKSCKDKLVRLGVLDD